MIWLEVQFPEEQVQHISQMVGVLPVMVLRAVESQVLPKVRALVADMVAIEPGSPIYPLRWKSEKQRRYVLGYVLEHDAEGTVIPYQRTHRQMAGWEVMLQVGNMAAAYGVQGSTSGGIAETAGLGAKGGSFAITLHHPSEVSQFVQGQYEQPYHRDTGWPNAIQKSVMIARQCKPLLELEWRVAHGRLITGVQGGV